MELQAVNFHAEIKGIVIGLVQWLDRSDFAAAVRTLAGDPISHSSSTAPAIASRSAEADDYEREQHRKAAWLWQQRRPLAGSPAERYLREVRGIDCKLPATLAYLAPTRSGHHPALMAVYGMPNEIEPGMAEPDNIDAVHLVLLRSDGAGKGDVKPNKITVGSPSGQPIVLAPLNDLLGSGHRRPRGRPARNAWPWFVGSGRASHMPTARAARPKRYAELQTSTLAGAISRRSRRPCNSSARLP